MEKTITLFKKENGRAINEVSEGAEWVMAGEGLAYKMITPDKKGKKQKDEKCSEALPLEGVERAFPSIENYFVATDEQGIVWHHPDGMIVEIRASDFGLKRGKQESKPKPKPVTLEADPNKD